MRRRKSRSPQIRRRKLRRRNRRRRIGLIVYRLMSIGLVCGAGAFALTIFFKINTVEITGTTRYSAAQIQQTLNVAPGDNLFFWGRTTGTQRVLREYPYISAVNVTRRLPDTLCIEVIESEAFAVVSDGNRGGYLINADGKLLEAVDNISALPLPFIAGVSVTGRAVGETLGGEQEAEARLVAVMQEMQAQGQLENVDFINLKQLGDIHIGYLERFDVQLGSTENLERKLQFLNKIVDEKLSPSDIGVIDLSNVSRMYFWPDKLENIQAVSGRPAQAVPDEAGDAADEADAQQGEAAGSGEEGTGSEDGAASAA